MLWGWALDIPALKSMVPGFTSLKANAALCFVLAGLALVCLDFHDSLPAARRTILVSASIILLVAGLTLIEQIVGFNFGIDQALVRDSETALALYPGRMATATAAGLFLAGVALAVCPFMAKQPRLAPFVRGLAYAVVGIGSMALVGYAINFNFLYTWYAFGSVALYAAFGLVVLGAALWSVNPGPKAAGDDVRITRLATTLLAGIAGITGIAVAAIMEREVERTLKEGLRIGLDSYIAQVDSTVEFRTTRAAIITTRPDLLEYVRQLNREPGDTQRRTLAQGVLESFAPHGFSAIAVELLDGQEAARMGRFVKEAALEVPLAGAMGTALLWKDGFYLHHRLRLQDQGEFLGTLTVEQPLPNLTRIVLNAHSFGETVEFLLCQSEARGGLRCFPNRLKSRPFFMESLPGRPTRLTQRPFSESAGLGTSFDYRGRRVMSAYGPVGNLGLIAAFNIDAEELYGSIGSKFFLALFLIALLITGGTLLVRARVRPLATGLELRVRERTAELAAANARLQESEERFRQVAAMSSQWIWEQDAAGRFIFSSSAVKDILGYEPEEIVGRFYHEFFAEEYRQQRLAGSSPADKPPQPFSGLINRYRHKDGHEVHTESTGAPILDEQGRVVKWRGVDYDIGWQRAKQAAEEASRAKSEFLANMSHEIRTPINGIIGMTELALDTELTPEQREYLTMVQESADSLLRLINDILDFSKIEAGKLDLEAIPFDLRDSLEGVIKTLALRAHKQQLELACHIPPDIPDRLVGDVGRLCQIVVNLVGNAIKFTERGEVLVDVAQESRTDTELVLHIKVKDTGIGIPPEKQRSIFGAFSQADGSTTRRFGGTGLGLAISARLVSLMGGRIWVESQVGRGSTFHFTVHLGLQAGASEPPRTELRDIQGLPVLIVDDHATNRRILEETLASWGMRPITADSGKAALRELQRLAEAGISIPLVLLDAMMPELDGFELAERIKQHPQYSGATIMMLSSAAHSGDAARCRGLGVAAYLVKPVKQSDLLDAILTILCGTRETDQPVRPARLTLPESRRLRVLLAEDNPVNQRLVVRMLEKRGHEVVVVNNGREALATLDRSPFDVVLMDVQMPEMDGFAATVAIREREKTTGRHVRIIAMTAHAMKGDRERCLAAGMDAYISKPIQTRQLFDLIEKGASMPSRELDSADSLPTFDRDVALARVEGDEALLQEIVQLFLEQTPGLVERIERAIALQDGQTLERTAHALKGSASNLGAKAMAAAAARLESIGRNGDFAAAETAYSELVEESIRLETILVPFRDAHLLEASHENIDR